jgi:PhoPQ-activated pathogenicity-related protein
MEFVHHSLMGSAELRSYLGSISAVSVRETGTSWLEVTSGTWQGTVWKNRVFLASPTTIRHQEAAIVWVTGEFAADVDLPRAQRIADLAGVPVAVIFDTPNQPYQGMVEDDLIAHTFEKYLETLDPTWPIVFPMTRGVLTVLEVLADRSRAFGNVILTGASKRGWTTWLAAAAGAPTLVGIAPAVYDNLNLPAQMAAQRAAWDDGYSPMIEDYTVRGLQESMLSGAGIELSRIVDPYTYRQHVALPTAIITGTNDAFWPVDAQQHYVSDLAGPVQLHIHANEGHSCGEAVLAGPEFVGFCDAVWQKEPILDWRKVSGGETLSATSDDRRFHAAEWHAEPPKSGARVTAHFQRDQRNGQTCCTPIVVKDYREIAI